MANVVVPRSFKLLDELEKQEKNTHKPTNGGVLSFGLVDYEDMSLSDWNASIMVLNGPLDGRNYTLLVHCDENYPDSQPQVRFKSKINLPIVDSQGRVAKWSGWTRDKEIYDFLAYLLSQMLRAPRGSQPGEDATFF